MKADKKAALNKQLADLKEDEPEVPVHGNPLVYNSIVRKAIVSKGG